MMKSILILQILFFIVFGELIGQDANTILGQMDQVMLASKDMQGEMRITLISKNGTDKSREAMLYQLGADKRLTVYTQPESQAGISTLSLPDGEMWLYLPALGGPKKISMLAKNQAFNNTDFSFEDMSRTPFTERFQGKIINTSAENYVLELIPKYEKSSYSKIILTIDKTNLCPTLYQYYDQKEELFKEGNYKYLKVGKYWFASEVNMTTLKKEHTTLIEVYNVKFDQGLEDKMFEVENLRKAK